MLAEAGTASLAATHVSHEDAECSEVCRPQVPLNSHAVERRTAAHG